MFLVSITYDGIYMLGPMPYVFLVSFVGVGLGGRFLDLNPARENWMMFIAITISASFWMAIGLSALYLLFLGITLIRYFVIWSLLGVVFAMFICALVEIIIRPQKRLHKIIVGATSSALIGYIGGYILLILILTPID